MDTPKTNKKVKTRERERMKREREKKRDIINEKLELCPHERHGNTEKENRYKDQSTKRDRQATIERQIGRYRARETQR